jgi:tryptophan synthase alpha chain
VTSIGSTSRGSTSRVEAAIDAAHAAGRGAFVGYLPVGFPDLRTSIEAAVALAENGVDIIELGPPYSDPVMDGTVIQEATQAALAAGFRLADLFTAVREITSRVEVPVLVMTYWNPVLQYGVDRYADDLLAAGGAGLITPDITPENAPEWIAASERTGLDRVFLAAPTSTDARLDLISASSTGFVYTVSTMGITGERAQLDAAARTLVGRLRAHGADKACVGIGISNAEQVAAVLEYADGAIVGTALVRALRDEGLAGLAETTRAIAAGTARAGATSPRT